MICEKTTYHSREQAEEAIDIFRHSLRTKKKPVRAYKCGACGGWHITSNKKKQHLQKSILKELHTSERKHPLPLFIINLTSRRLTKTMARLYVLLGGLLIVAVSASGFSDSRVKQTQTYQVSIHDYDFELTGSVHSSVSVAELPVDFLIVHPDLGKAETVHKLSVVRIHKKHVQVIRPPPGQCLRQKSDYNQLSSK
jgi:hypothetical protein